MISKHYSNHYFIPVNALFIVQLFLIIQFWLNVVPVKFTKVLQITTYLTIMFLVLKNAHGTLNQRNASDKFFAEEFEEIVPVLANKNDSIPFFIKMRPYGDPCVETGIYFGFLWAGKHREDYIDDLKELYPTTYIFDNYYKKIMHWYRPMDTLKMRESLPGELLIYMEEENDSIRNKIVTDIKLLYGYNFEMDTLHKNIPRHQYFFKAHFTDN